MAREQNVVEVLLEQHSQIKALFRDVATAKASRKQELFEELVRLLAVHESAEEEVVHPMARRKIDDGDVIVESRLEEEDEAKDALAELYDLGLDHPEFNVRLQLLADAVTEHAANEESEEFSHLLEVLEPETLQKMAGAVKAAEAVAPTRPHPMVGESATANVLLGPPLALFDRTRDAIRNWQSQSG
jgi:hemerythrin superfamily protein